MFRCNVWMNGGTGGWGFTVAGMQQLYNAVRATGANNLVIVGGLNYAYDLTCVKTNPLIGTNVVYNTRPTSSLDSTPAGAYLDQHHSDLLQIGTHTLDSCSPPHP